MSRKGDLVAYSSPANIKRLRDQAALASMALNECASEGHSRAKGIVHVRGDDAGVDSFAIPGTSHNMVVQRINEELFLVLLGDTAPGTQPYQSSSGNVDDYGHDPAQIEDLLDASDSTAFDKRLLVLHSQKARAIADYLKAQLDGKPSDADD